MSSLVQVYDASTNDIKREIHFVSWLKYSHWAESRGDILTSRRNTFQYLTRHRTTLIHFLFTATANKNLAIANRSRVSCAHNTLRASRHKYYTVILKSRLRVTQGHWKRKHRIDHTRLTISRVIWRWISSWPWNVGYRSLKVIECGTIWKLGYGFLFAFHSNYGRIFSHFGDIQRQRMAWPWNLSFGSFKVIENGMVR